MRERKTEMQRDCLPLVEGPRAEEPRRRVKRLLHSWLVLERIRLQLLM